MGLSRDWRTVLSKLAEYPDGIKQEDLSFLLGPGCNAALTQMFFKDMGYYDRVVGTTVIKITETGRKALRDG